MLNDFLKNLQNKSESSKMKILYFAGAITIVLVLMIWVSSFGEYKAAFNNPANSDIVNSLKATVAEPIINIQTSQDASSKIQEDNQDIEVQSSKFKVQINSESQKSNSLLEEEKIQEEDVLLESNFNNSQEEKKAFKLPVSN